MMEVERRLAVADLLIVNKLGKREAEGCGLRPVIADAFARGISVLVGVSAIDHDAFVDFSGGMAEALRPDIGLVHNWATTTYCICDHLIPAHISL